MGTEPAQAGRAGAERGWAVSTGAGLREAQGHGWEGLGGGRRAPRSWPTCPHQPRNQQVPQVTILQSTCPAGRSACVLYPLAQTRRAWRAACFPSAGPSGDRLWGWGCTFALTHDPAQPRHPRPRALHRPPGSHCGGAATKWGAGHPLQTDLGAFGSQSQDGAA